MNNNKITIYIDDKLKKDSYFEELIKFISSYDIEVSLQETHLQDFINTDSSEAHLVYDTCLRLFFNNQSVSFDWAKEYSVHVKKKYKISKEPFARALGIKGQKPFCYIDATAGTGKDAMLAYSFGASIVLFERNIFVFSLICCAYQRFCMVHEKALEDLRLAYGSVDETIDLDNIDAIYYDPMYPAKKKKSAKSRKEMEVFKDIVGPDEDIEDVLHRLHTLHSHLVVKRPLKSPQLLKPSYSYEGKTTRYDVYRR